MTITLQAVNELIQSLESAGELSIKERKYLELAKAYQQLAAENVGLKAAINAVNRTAEECEVNGDELKYVVEPSEFEALIDLLDETPATDRIVAGIKADGRAEGINFAAGRLAAAFNHGFVDKPMAEVFDVVRMILTAKEDLANDPAADGLSGEYAEKSLAEWEAALREGADK
ncbi:hypothetical protein QTO66_27005 [Klebsiella oxytoca]|uniref:hypothetical protein n=1 Tax=Klebsiella oxytoca TaxID=571 RepID=UPI001CCE031A|nr:hypothetical protein [Klebsiella oxytoca]MCW9651551.1 hypothetical protein [Klebsiella oxytoca]MDM4108203.1 hypothetical protein [Klebsiella oxytoca]